MQQRVTVRETGDVAGASQPPQPGRTRQQPYLGDVVGGGRDALGAPAFAELVQQHLQRHGGHHTPRLPGVRGCVQGGPCSGVSAQRGIGAGCSVVRVVIIEKLTFSSSALWTLIMQGTSQPTPTSIPVIQLTGLLVTDSLARETSHPPAHTTLRTHSRSDRDGRLSEPGKRAAKNRCRLTVGTQRSNRHKIRSPNIRTLGKPEAARAPFNYAAETSRLSTSNRGR